MTTAMLIKGHLIGPTRVELDEPIDCATAEVEVLVRPPAQPALDEEPWSAYLAGLPIGVRSTADINSQIAQERDSWGA